MSTGDPFPFFSEPCKQAFGFLVERYAFSPPEEEQLGRERFIRYQKRNKTVSIAYEPGLSPIVELFFPSRDLKNRRFPKHDVVAGPKKKPKRWSDDRMSKFLATQASELERNEREFLENEE
jgi:hypothetical protein